MKRITEIDHEIERKIKEILCALEDLQYKDLPSINLRNLLYNCVTEAIGVSGFQLFKRIIKRIAFSNCVLRYCQSVSKFLFISYDYGRSDHKILWNSICNLLDEKSELKVSVSEPLTQMYSGWKTINKLFYFFSCSHLLKSAGIQKERFILAADIAQAIELYRNLAHYKFNEKVGVVFFDGNVVENLIVQVLKSLGMVVVTMQHGQPVFHGHNRDFLNQTMILNFSSNYIIVPGEFSRRQFILGGVPDQSIKVLGTLKPVMQYKKTDSGLFSVLLDCPTYHFSKRINNMLIEIADEISKIFSMNYAIKLHPQDNIQNYNIAMLERGVVWKEDLNDCICKTDFSIMHFTGAYIDVIACAHKAFVLNENEEYPFCDISSEQFRSVKDLVTKIESWINKTIDEQQKYIEAIRDYYLSPYEAQKRHRNFLYELVGKE